MSPLESFGARIDESRVRRRSRASKTFEDDPGVAAARADILGEAQASLVANA